MLHVEEPGFRSRSSRISSPDFTERVGSDEQVQNQPPWRLGHRTYALVHQNLPRYLRTSRGSGLFRRARVREQHADTRGLICRHSNRLQTSTAKQEGGCCKAARCNVFCTQTRYQNAIELRNPPDGVPAPWGAASLPATRTLPYPLRYGRGCVVPADQARQQGHR